MHQLLNVRSGKTISFPEDVHELTPEQYLFYLDIVLQNIMGELTNPADIKRRLFTYFTNLRVSWKLMFRSADVEEAIWCALTEKINLLDSFFDTETTPEGTNRLVLHVKHTENLLPEWNGYRGPLNFLNDVTWGQFKQCLNAMKMQKIATDERNVADIERYTCDIFHALYRPGLKWKPRNSKIKTQNSKLETRKSKRIPDTVQFHALMYFSYWYELITTYPITINGEEVEFFQLWKGDADDTNNDKSGWMGITFGIAESGVFGDAAEVDTNSTLNVLMYLYRQRMLALAEEEKLKKQQP